MGSSSISMGKLKSIPLRGSGTDSQWGLLICPPHPWGGRCKGLSLEEQTSSLDLEEVVLEGDNGGLDGMSGGRFCMEKGKSGIFIK